MKKIFYYLSLILILYTVISCENILNIENKVNITPDDVWNDYKMANAYITNLYSMIVPGQSQNDGKSTDEAATIYDGTMNSFLNGQATIDSWGSFENTYKLIRSINFVFPNLEKGSIPEDQKKQIRGQALFFRAWLYWKMVKMAGGVPLILEPQSQYDIENIFLERTPTSECINQIIKDLDEAISLLPSEWNSSEWNKVTSGIAMAVKGEVLLWWASPLFNPQNDAKRWTDAYNATKAAKDFLVTNNGRGLFKPYNDIWDTEGLQNEEVVFVRVYQFPGSTYNQQGMRPLLYSQDAHDEDRPSLELVNAFPMKDGSKFDPNVIDYKNLHKNRDDRFYTTIAYNGSYPYLKELIDGGWNMWTYRDGSFAADTKDGNLYSSTSFYRAKGIDKTVTQATRGQCGLDNIIIRFAEVLMNYGEASNGAGKPDEALNVLYQIRQRAGIEPGPDNKYGITASNRAEIFNAYLEERQIEFAFEAKRWNDIRRMRRFDVLRNVKQRHGLKILLKTGMERPDRNANLDDVIDRFDYEVVNCDELKNLGIINPKDEYYFMPIAKSDLDRNSNLKQTKGWDNGTFDPLL